MMEHEQPVRTTKKDDADEEETTKIKKPPTTKKRKSRLLRELEDHLGLPDPSCSSSSDDDSDNDSDIQPPPPTKKMKKLVVKVVAADKKKSKSKNKSKPKKEKMKQELYHRRKQRYHDNLSSSSELSSSENEDGENVNESGNKHLSPIEKMEKEIETKKTVDRYSNGTRIMKQFENGGDWYNGTIKSYNKRRGYYSIKFDDGENEEFDDDDVKQWLKDDDDVQKMKSYNFKILWGSLKDKGWEWQPPNNSFDDYWYCKPASMQQRPKSEWIQGLDYFCTQEEVTAFCKEQERDGALSRDKDGGAGRNKLDDAAPSKNEKKKSSLVKRTSTTTSSTITSSNNVDLPSNTTTTMMTIDLCDSSDDSESDDNENEKTKKNKIASSSSIPQQQQEEEYMVKTMKTNEKSNSSSSSSTLVAAIAAAAAAISSSSSASIHLSSIPVQDQEEEELVTTISSPLLLRHQSPNLYYHHFWNAIHEGNSLKVQKYLKLLFQQENCVVDDDVLNAPKNLEFCYSDSDITAGISTASENDIDIDTDCGGSNSNTFDETPLYVATNNGSIDIVEYLLKQPHIDVNNSENINLIDKRPLFASCRNGNIEITTLLLKAGATPTCADSKGSTPLHVACSYGWISIAKLLLDYLYRFGGNSSTSTSGINPKIELVRLSDNHGFTPLHSAVWGENYTCTDDDGNGGDNGNGNNLSKRKEDIVQLLLNRGANIDAQDKEGETVLHLALLDMSILPINNNIPNTATDSVLYATSPLVELLLKHGANKTICDENGNSFFHKYARNEKVRISNNELLLLSKSNVTYNVTSKTNPLLIKNNSGKTPIELAKEYNQEDIQKIFHNYISKLDYNEKQQSPQPHHVTIVFYTQRLGFVITTPSSDNSDNDGNGNSNGNGVIVSNVRNDLHKDQVFAGDKIIAIGTTNVSQQTIDFVTDMILTATRPVAITFLRRSRHDNNNSAAAATTTTTAAATRSNNNNVVVKQVQKQQQQQPCNNNNEDNNSKYMMTPKSISLLSTQVAAAATTTATKSSSSSSSSRSEDEEIAHDVVFYTQRLGLHLQVISSTGEITIKAVSNEEYNDIIFPGDILISAGDLGVLKHKSMSEVSTFITSSKRPLSIRFKRPQQQQQQRDKTQQLAAKKLLSSSSSPTGKQQQQQYQQHQKPIDIPDDGSHSLREVLNILSPEILSDSIKSDDDDDDYDANLSESSPKSNNGGYDTSDYKQQQQQEGELAESQNERQARLKSEARAHALKKVVVEPPPVTNKTMTTTTSSAVAAAAVSNVPPSVINKIRYDNTKILYNCPLCHKTFRSKGGLEYHTDCQVCLSKDLKTLLRSSSQRSAQGAKNPPVEYDLLAPPRSPASSSLSSPEGVTVTIPGIGIATTSNKERVAAAATNNPNVAASVAAQAVTIKNNDTIKKLEGRGGGNHPLIHPLPIVDASQSVVSIDFQNVAHGSGPTTSAAMTIKEEDVTSSGSRADMMYPDAALSEHEEEEFPLHACVKFGFLDFLEDELRKDTTVVNAVDTHGRTALDLAALTGQLILVNRLREAGGVFRYKNGPRMAALANNRSKAMEKYLKEVRTSVG
jgi:ankyrin repeat protein